jgi:ApaG protein
VTNTDPEHPVDVAVVTTYVEEQSDPAASRFVFAYTITIRNQGPDTIQLLTRHWVITDADSKIQEVRGEGVVGQQPIIRPGEYFRYSSGAVLETPVGVMQGSYQMITSSGARFDAPIAAFSLAIPGIVH